MTIHHATVKAAEKKGIALDWLETEETCCAIVPQYGIQIEYPDPKLATALAALAIRFRANGYAVEVTPIENEEWGVESHEGTMIIGFDPMQLLEKDGEDEIFADTLEQATEEGIDIDEDYEVEHSGSIVSPKYKKRYAEQGDPTCCGDWFALWLKGEFTVKVGGKGRPVFDREGFTLLLEENGIDLTAPWATTPKQNNGTYKMSGRKALEHAIQTNLGGTFTYNGKDMGRKVPKEWKTMAKEWKEAQAKKAENKKKQQKIAA